MVATRWISSKWYVTVRTCTCKGQKALRAFITMSWNVYVYSRKEELAVAIVFIIVVVYASYWGIWLMLRSLLVGSHVFCWWYLRLPVEDWKLGESRTTPLSVNYVAVFWTSCSRGLLVKKGSSESWRLTFISSHFVRTSLCTVLPGAVATCVIL